MADPDTPNQASNKEKAEGDRWQPDSETVERADRGGGITNRPLQQERENQEALPTRGRSKNRRRMTDDG